MQPISFPRARCNADKTAIPPLTKTAQEVIVGNCEQEAVREQQQELCREALEALKQMCNDACGFFDKLDEFGQIVIGEPCARDGIKSTATANPGCTVTALEQTLVAQPLCSATIDCRCDP